MSPDEKKEMSKQVLDYVNSEFSYQTTIDLWDKTLNDLTENWKENYARVICREI